VTIPYTHSHVYSCDLRVFYSFPTRRSYDLQVEVVMRAQVAVGVHGDEPRVLQEPRIHAPAGARVARRHRVDQLRLEPRVRLGGRSEEHTSELQSRENLVCRLLLEQKKTLRS